MARKSRKTVRTADTAQKTQDGQAESWRTALYARISVEDQRKLENDSIGNQVELLKSYAAGRPELAVSEVYLDCGESGMNFERPGFQRMMSDIRGGRINCVIVKDLSRFGRNYIETGNYIEQIFPYLGVRFISINDRFDSAKLGRKELPIAVPLKNIVNELYAKDISAKVRAQFVVKQKNGEFLGSFAPYGYLKSPQDHHKLVVDPQTSSVVQSIFAWRLEGLGCCAIASKLTAAGIPSPAKYRYEQGIVTNGRYADAKRWHKSAVQRILANPAYQGDMVQGKQKTNLILQNSRRELPPDAWATVCGTHEAIVSRADFARAQGRQTGEERGRADGQQTGEAGSV